MICVRIQRILADDVRQKCDNIIFAAQRAKEREKINEAAALEAEAKRVTLNKFIDQFLEDIKAGRRQTEKGTKYAASTVKSIKQALTKFAQFQKDKRRKYDFDDGTGYTEEDYLKARRERDKARRAGKKSQKKDPKVREERTR